MLLLPQLLVFHFHLLLVVIRRHRRRGSLHPLLVPVLLAGGLLAPLDQAHLLAAAQEAVVLRAVTWGEVDINLVREILMIVLAINSTSKKN